MNNSKHINFYTFEGEQKSLNTFIEAYLPQKIINVSEKPSIDLKNKSVRTCRFCGISNNKNVFKKKAHFIPHFLGNPHFLNDFECDNCNRIFGEFETDLADYLAVERVVSGTKGKNSFSKIKQSEKYVKWNNDVQGTQGIEVEGASGSDIVIDEEKEKIIAQFKLSYIPLQIYKALLKIALSTLEDGEVKLYNEAIKFLFDNKYLSEFKGFAKILRYDVDRTYRVPNPICALFKKVNLHDKIPMHFFFLYYENIIFCFPLPYNLLDIKNGCYDSIGCLIPPPVLFSPPLNGDIFKKEFKDLSSLTKLSQTTDLSLNVSMEKLLEIWRQHPSYDPEVNVSDLKLTGYIFAPNS